MFFYTCDYAFFLFIYFFNFWIVFWKLVRFWFDGLDAYGFKIGREMTEVRAAQIPIQLFNFIASNYLRLRLVLIAFASGDL